MTRPRKSNKELIAQSNRLARFVSKRAEPMAGPSVIPVVADPVAKSAVRDMERRGARSEFTVRPSQDER